MRQSNPSFTMRGVAVLILLACKAVVVAAQAPATAMPTPGMRVRVTLDGAREPIVGSVVSARADSIAYVPLHGAASDTAVVALRQLRALEVSSGPRLHVLRSVGWGFAGGSVGGAVLGAATYSPCTETGFMSCFMAPESRSQSALLGGVIGALLGTSGGLVVGLFHRSDDWQPLSTERVARLRVVPSARGVSASVSLALP